MKPASLLTFLCLVLLTIGLLALLGGCASKPIPQTEPIGVTRAEASAERTAQAVATATQAAQEVDAAHQQIETAHTEIRTAHATLGDSLNAMAQTIDRLLSAPSTLGNQPDENDTLYLADPPPLQ